MTRAKVNCDDLRIGDRARGVLGEKVYGAALVSIRRLSQSLGLPLTSWLQEEDDDRDRLQHP
ncbi:hypothetical protein F2Q69_00034752 [Brassica cretica]|uniref:Uncharacterized protein n=1 Tax=Brassica cretica TaxID=69181 RepID=A0A8S9SSL3_BRACR|nr:hypothetical protein F2Q69_00034752 [Brassica cretica]